MIKLSRVAIVKWLRLIVFGIVCGFIGGYLSLLFFEVMS